jgi:hypothetical protein
MLEIIYFFSKSLEEDPNFKVTVCEKGFWIHHSRITDFLPFKSVSEGCVSWDIVSKKIAPIKIPNFPLFASDTLWFSVIIPNQYVTGALTVFQYPQKHIYAKFNVFDILERFITIKKLFIKDLWCKVTFLVLKTFIYYYPINAIQNPFIYWNNAQEAEKDIIRNLPKGFLANALVS